MEQNSVFDFADFNAEVFDLYKSTLRKALSDPAEVKAFEDDAEEVASGEKAAQSLTGVEDASMPGKRARRKKTITNPEPRRGRLNGERDDVEMSRSVALIRLSIWRHVFDVGPHLRRLGVPTLPADPFMKEAPGKIAKDLAESFEEEIPPLPDEVAKPILAYAHKMIMEPAEDVIRLQAGFLLIDPRGGPRPPRTINRPLAAHVRGFAFSSRDGGGAWRAPIVPTPRDLTGGLSIRQLILQIRDACAIVLLSDVGMRISELCGIEIDDREIDDELPSCIEVDTSISQFNEHFFIRGFLTKKQIEPMPERWLLGARPVGSDWEPPGVRAVRVLERLLQPWRRLAEDDLVSRRLFVGFERGTMPRDGKSILPVLANSMRVAMRESIAEHVPLKRLLQTSLASNPEVFPYATSDGRCIRPHQWRKTFLRYLIRIDGGLLPAISQHFKHMTMAITEGSYMPKDPALLDAVDSVRAQEVTRFLYERRYGKKRGFDTREDMIAESESQLRDLIGNRSYADARGDLETFAADHDLEVFAGAHGQCLIGLRPDAARCHRFSSRPAWEARAPDLVTRTPSLCAGCVNFSPGSGSADFWRRWYTENMTAWIESGYEPSFRVARSRGMQATAILRSLGVPPPLLLARSPRGPRINPYTGEELR
jgi:integrase